MGLVSLFVIAIISLGTYAIWNSELLTGDNTIKSGQIKMSYTETNEITMENALPMKDEEGKVLTNYFDFQVLSYIKTRANDSTQRKLSYDVILEPLTVETPLKDNEIKVYLTMVENGKETEVVKPTTIDKLINYLLNTHEDIFSNNKGEVVTSYRLRAWVDEKVDPAKFNDKKYSYKFRVNVNSSKINELVEADTSGANAPELTSNMIPVYYDEKNDVWRKADTLNENSNWYNYDKKKWANAVTANETNREKYLTADIGTVIPMDDINTMWVWIPRYKYTYLNTNTPQSINIKFEKGTSSSGTISCKDSTSPTASTSETCTDTTNNGLVAGTSTYTHPAFWWDKNDNNVREENEELTGIWVGKFEVSSDTSCTPSDYVAVGSGCNLQTIRPQIKPNVTSWRGAQVGTFFNGIQKMRESGNKYGFATTDETHMMKNMEWGAVAYLSHSKYGINKEINANNSRDYYTGRSGGNVGGATPINGTYPEQNNSSQYNKYGFYTYDGYLLDYDTNIKSEIRDMSKVASTTGNIYGIYDMSGGAEEYMMADLVYTNGTMISGWTKTHNSDFTGILGESGTLFTGTYAFPSKRYYDKYSYGTTSKDSTAYSRGKLGDATKEMAPTEQYGNWYDDYASFIMGKAYTWATRGYMFSDKNSGIFAFSIGTGNASSYYSARAVISNLN